MRARRRPQKANTGTYAHGVQLHFHSLTIPVLKKLIALQPNPQILTFTPCTTQPYPNHTQDLRQQEATRDAQYVSTL